MNGTVTQAASTMFVGQAPEDAGEAYPLVERLIHHQVAKFQRAYGGEYEDLLGDAHEAFMRGHRQFVRGTMEGGAPVKISYAATIRHAVWYDLLDQARNALRREKIAPMHNIEDGQDFAVAGLVWRREDFAEDLGPDARVVLELILDPPETLCDAIEKKGDQPRNYRSTLRGYLAKQGWGPVRINAAFDDIKAHLS